jgi:hypothetical protein
MASWPPSIVHPTASVGGVSLTSPPRATPTAQEGAAPGGRETDFHPSSPDGARPDRPGLRPEADREVRATFGLKCGCGIWRIFPRGSSEVSQAKTRHERSLAAKYPPSEPCACAVCLAYCMRPGWWTVREAAAAYDAEYARRMMLEPSPERTFGVLSPAFRGCEGTFALQQYATRGCAFLRDGRCELHGSGFQPMECRFCHHDRPGRRPADGAERANGLTPRRGGPPLAPLHHSRGGCEFC